MIYDLIILGGGAAGIFAAIQAKIAHPHFSILLLEKTNQLLTKVKISGGGRCNVTHHCMDSKELVKNYPRGQKELLGPFTRFGPQEMIAYLQSIQVPLKIEEDGRMFPKTNHSSTIIEAFLSEIERLKVTIEKKVSLQSLEKKNQAFILKSKEKEYISRNLLLATGSHPSGHQFAKELGHQIVKPVPSLFTFNIPDFAFKELSGISLKDVELKMADTSLKAKGDLLITHFGFSGPLALKLSAFGARLLNDQNYQATLLLDLLPESSFLEVEKKLIELKREEPKKTLLNQNPFYLPKRLWALLAPKAKSVKLSDHAIREFAISLKRIPFKMKGKTTHKEEFVTAGGIDLKEVNFRTFESKICPNLYFSGEILNIDGITGGFNFQNAWTTAFMASQSMT
ncbi:MAG: NAD(P)/FAD-dependent oxidoreductase [Simkaniaceae bacterium]